MVTAVEKVRDRLRRAVQALEQAQIPYAVAGGNAVAAWVAEVDEAAVRNTQDVDILLRRADLDRAKEALAKAGFIYRHAASIDMFLDGPNAKASTSRVLSLDAILRMKLTSFRDKDRMHVRDLIDVGLIDASWCERLPDELAKRLQSLLDNPDG
jgi:hypothetical protein